mmetsp:Transcript_3538/g.9626  ORF Transcript_3538/g.9626 Transcript_3538/m.9626 type:complete len:205 (-) Transcript_3538:269-883(-)
MGASCTACSTCSKSRPGPLVVSDRSLAKEGAGRISDKRILLLRFREVMKKDFQNPKDAFDMLDRNGDHVVSKDEWMATLGTVGQRVKWDVDTMAMMLRWGEQFFEQVDSNGNGNLAQFKEIMKKSFKDPKEAFNMLDADKNGEVDKEEWLATLAEVGKSAGWDTKTVSIVEDFGEAFFDQMDTNLNGVLSFKEFKENLKKRLEE